MPPFHRLDDRVSVAPQLSAADMPAVAAAGFKVVVNNRPDGEALFGQPKSSDLAKAARAAGLAYHDLPFTGARASIEQVKRMAGLMEAEGGPILAFCKSGTRSSLIWAAAALAQGRPLPEVLAAAAVRGYDLAALGDTITRLGQAAR